MITVFNFKKIIVVLLFALSFIFMLNLWKITLIVMIPVAAFNVTMWLSRWFFKKATGLGGK